MYCTYITEKLMPPTLSIYNYWATVFQLTIVITYSFKSKLKLDKRFKQNDG